jgi:hypothetical protein
MLRTSTVKLEATYSSETLGPTYMIALYQNPQHHNL